MMKDYRKIAAENLNGTRNSLVNNLELVDHLMTVIVGQTQEAHQNFDAYSDEAHDTAAEWLPRFDTDNYDVEIVDWLLLRLKEKAQKVGQMNHSRKPNARIRNLKD